MSPACDHLQPEEDQQIEGERFGDRFGDGVRFFVSSPEETKNRTPSPFLIACFLTREYTMRMLFCDKVFISSKIHQVLYNNPLSRVKVKYRSAWFAKMQAELFCL